MEPVRVLQVFASLDRGGAETMIMSVYRSIDRMQVQFDFAVNEREKDYAYESEIVALGGRVYRLPKFAVTNCALYRRAWVDFLSAHPEWSIIHGHHTSSAFVYLRVANSLGRVTIAHSHIAGRDRSAKSLMKMLVRYPLRYTADHLFACSKAAAKWMFGSHSVSTSIVNNAIDAQIFVFSESARSVKRQELGISDKFVVGHIGRFSIQKNHELLIRVFKEVYDRKGNAVLLLVGDGELRPQIEEQVDALDLSESVVFTGVREDVPELLQAMDVFVFPSFYEGLGIVAVEAQAAGLHCIVADTIPEEAFVTDLVEAIPLKAPIGVWAEKIVQCSSGYKRNNTYEQIRASGYDIRETANWLGQFYLRESKGRPHV